MKNYLAAGRAGDRHEKLSRTMCDAEYTVAPRSMTGSFSGPPGPAKSPADRTWTHTRIPKDPKVRMLLSFQRPSRPAREGGSFSEDAPGELTRSGADRAV